jgi:hypothetical protein
MPSTAQLVQVFSWRREPSWGSRRPIAARNVLAWMSRCLDAIAGDRCRPRDSKAPEQPPEDASNGAFKPPGALRKGRWALTVASEA